MESCPCASGQHLTAGISVTKKPAGALHLSLLETRPAITLHFMPTFAPALIPPRTATNSVKPVLDKPKFPAPPGSLLQSPLATLSSFSIKPRTSSPIFPNFPLIAESCLNLDAPQRPVLSPIALPVAPLLISPFQKPILRERRPSASLPSPPLCILNNTLESTTVQSHKKRPRLSILALPNCDIPLIAPPPTKKQAYNLQPTPESQPISTDSPSETLTVPVQTTVTSQDDKHPEKEQQQVTSGTETSEPVKKLPIEKPHFEHTSTSPETPQSVDAGTVHQPQMPTTKISPKTSPASSPTPTRVNSLSSDITIRANINKVSLPSMSALRPATSALRSHSDSTTPKSRLLSFFRFQACRCACIESIATYSFVTNPKR